MTRTIWRNHQKPEQRFNLVTSLGDISNFLGIKIKRNEKGVSFSQQMYIKQVLEQLGINSTKSSKYTLDSGNIQQKEYQEPASLEDFSTCW